MSRHSLICLVLPLVELLLPSDFDNDVWTNHFTFAQASAVNDYMLKDNNRKQDAEGLSSLSRPFITENGYNKSKTKLQNVANNFKAYEQAERERLERERQEAEKNKPKWRMHR